MGVTVSHGRAAAAKAQEFATAAFLELLILAELLHFRASPKVIERCFPHIADDAVKAAAGHHIAIGADGKMTVAAVAAVVNKVLVQPFRNLEQPVLVQIQRPQMVLQVEISPGILVFLKLLPTTVQHVPILQRRQMGRFFRGGGAIASESKDIGFVGHYGVDDFFHLIRIHGRYRSHDGHLDAGLLQNCNPLQRDVVGARFAHPVMRLPIAVDGELVLLAAVRLETGTDFVGQMEGIAQDSKGDVPLLEHSQDFPNLRMQHRVSSSDIEIRHALLHPGAHVHAIVNNPTSIRQADGNQLRMPLGKDVTVFTPLITIISDVPLECEIMKHIYLFSERSDKPASAGRPTGRMCPLIGGYGG